MTERRARVLVAATAAPMHDQASLIGCVQHIIMEMVTSYIYHEVRMRLRNREGESGYRRKPRRDGVRRSRRWRKRTTIMTTSTRITRSPASVRPAVTIGTGIAGAESAAIDAGQTGPNPRSRRRHFRAPPPGPPPHRSLRRPMHQIPHQICTGGRIRRRSTGSRRRGAVPARTGTGITVPNRPTRDPDPTISPRGPPRRRRRRAIRHRLFTGRRRTDSR